MINVDLYRTLGINNSKLLPTYQVTFCWCSMRALLLLLALYPWLQTCQAKPKPWLHGDYLAYPAYNRQEHTNFPERDQLNFPRIAQTIYPEVAQINFPDRPGFGRPIDIGNGNGIGIRGNPNYDLGAILNVGFGQQPAFVSNHDFSKPCGGNGCRGRK